MSFLIIARRTWGLMDFLKAAEDPGRKKGKPVGSYLGDLTELKKSILLCSQHARKFDAKRHRYEKPRGIPYFQGECDVCREFTPQGAFFVHEENMGACFSGPRRRR